MKWLFAPALRLAVTAAVLVSACLGHSGPPTAPSGTQNRSSTSACAPPPYVISGVISASQGGPLADATIQVLPYPYGLGTSAKTDAQGRFSACGVTAPKVGLQIWRSGYTTAFKYDLLPHDQTVNLALRQDVQVPVGGGTLNGTIRGDEFEAGDDDFGGVCEHTACKVVSFSYNACPCQNRSVEITVRWADVSSQLALYFSNDGVYFPPPSPVPPATRYSSPSPVVATYNFNADFDRFAIGFEQAAGGQPGPNDSQAFELTLRPRP
jgi:hypothetical protein